MYCDFVEVAERGKYKCLLYGCSRGYYNKREDVCIPILGFEIIRMDDTALRQQELFDIIIASCKLSVSKIKKPNKLIITCKRSDGFSLYKIGEYI